MLKCAIICCGHFFFVYGLRFYVFLITDKTLLSIHTTLTNAVWLDFSKKIIRTLLIMNFILFIALYCGECLRVYMGSLQIVSPRIRHPIWNLGHPSPTYMYFVPSPPLNSGGEFSQGIHATCITNQEQSGKIGKRII